MDLFGFTETQKEKIHEVRKKVFNILWPSFLAVFVIFMMSIVASIDDKASQVSNQVI